MITKFLTFSVVITSAYCQYAIQNEMKADMTFGDDNERFDARPMFEPKRNYYEEPDYRRHLDYVPNIRSKGNKHANLVASLRRIGNDEFATHDNMVSGPEDGTMTEYERTFYKIRKGEYRRKLQNIVDDLHGVPKGGRRSSDAATDPEREILLHYAVPVEMKIQGYMQKPSDE